VVVAHLLCKCNEVVKVGMVLLVVQVVVQELPTPVLVTVVRVYNQAHQVVVTETLVVIKPPKPVIILVLVVGVQELLVRHRLRAPPMEVMVGQVYK
jgi:hypothetical protein